MDDESHFGMEAVLVAELHDGGEARLDWVVRV